MNSWSAPRRMVHLLVGLVLYGIADGLIVQAALGISPWSVLAQGIALRTGLLFGVVTNLLGLLVLLLWIPLRQRPGIGTVLNVLLVGTAAQAALWLVPAPPGLAARIALFTGGLLLLAVATGLYVGASYGPGPRDGLMTGVSARFGWPIWLARSVIEITVLALGWVLGGNVGIGTLAFALLIGPLCNLTLPLFSGPARRPAPLEGGPECSPA